MAIQDGLNERNFRGPGKRELISLVLPEKQSSRVVMAFSKGHHHRSPKPKGDFFLLPPSPYISFHFRSSFILAASYATEAPTYGTIERYWKQDTDGENKIIALHEWIFILKNNIYKRANGRADLGFCL